MGRTKEQQAAYMRDYRARKRMEVDPNGPDAIAKLVRVSYLRGASDADDEVAARIEELEEEVGHLKRELAASREMGSSHGRTSSSASVGEMRGVQVEPLVDHPFNSRPFTPVPRKRG